MPLYPICDLCWELGDIKIAVGKYMAGDDNEYYICEDCEEKVKEAKLPITKLDKDEEIVGE